MDLRIGRLRITPGAVFMTTLLVFLDRDGWAGLLLLAVTAHEAGHLAALGLCRAPVLYVEVSAAGVCIRYAGSLLSYGRELFVAAMGPAAGALLALLAAWIGAAAEADRLLLLSGFSMALTAFNLLPLRGLDGGRMVRTLLCARFGPTAADRVSEGLDAVFRILLIAFGVFLLSKQGSWTVLLAISAILLSLRRRQEYGRVL